MTSEFELAINQICEEKGLKKEEIIETIGVALAAAYKKDYNAKGQNIKVEFDSITGASKVFDIKDVVKNEEEKKKPKRELTLKEAKKIKKDVKVGDQIITEVTPREIHFGRIAAQTAKQVIQQRIREAEKNMILNTFKEKIGKVLNVTVQRIERMTIFVDLGITSGLLLPQDQIMRERYRIGQRLKVYIKETSSTPRGPEIFVSRTHPDIVKELFKQEVPEIANGSVEVKAVAREAGSRSKIAVYTEGERVDPIGACVGQRGIRVQTVISELGGEKIDIIEWHKDPIKFITNALAPAKIISVRIDEKYKKAEVMVREDQLSLAIGRDGQNVRLAVRLTGWNIDIIKEEAKKVEVKKEEKTAKKGKKLIKKEIKAKKEEKKTKTGKKEKMTKKEEPVKKTEEEEKPIKKEVVKEEIKKVEAKKEKKSSKKKTKKSEEKKEEKIV